ncbi:MAG: ABC transporter ATP-binding protein [Deinococcales bacterium]
MPLMHNTPPALEAKSIHHSFAGTGEVLRGVSFTLEMGGVLAVLGASGSGKSTLLHLLGGLEPPTSGELYWAGQHINPLSQEQRSKLRTKEVGFIFQHHYLLEDLSVEENVLLPSLIANSQDSTRAQMLLERVGLLERKYAYPRTLSGGERQRCALARALVTKPRFVLADEPTGSLDRANAEHVFALLLELARLEQSAVVVVTHDEGLAQKADRIIRLSDGVLVSDKAHRL